MSGNKDSNFCNNWEDFRIPFRRVVRLGVRPPEKSWRCSTPAHRPHLNTWRSDLHASFRITTVVAAIILYHIYWSHFTLVYRRCW